LYDFDLQNRSLIANRPGNPAPVYSTLEYSSDFRTVRTARNWQSVPVGKPYRNHAGVTSLNERCGMRARATEIGIGSEWLQRTVTWQILFQTETDTFLVIFWRADISGPAGRHLRRLESCFSFPLDVKIERSEDARYVSPVTVVQPSGREIAR
jgi:hypothetical protein